MDVQFELPWPPTVNSYWKPITRKGTGALVLTGAATAYREVALSMLQKQKMKGLAILDPVAITVTYHPPTKRKYDIDNFLKGTFDAITHGYVWKDDEQIVDMRVTKGPVKKFGRVQIQISTTIPPL